MRNQLEAFWVKLVWSGCDFLCEERQQQQRAVMTEASVVVVTDIGLWRSAPFPLNLSHHHLLLYLCWIPRSILNWLVCFSSQVANTPLITWYSSFLSSVIWSQRQKPRLSTVSWLRVKRLVASSKTTPNKQLLSWSAIQWSTLHPPGRIVVMDILPCWTQVSSILYMTLIPCTPMMTQFTKALHGQHQSAHSSWHMPCCISQHG